MKLKHLLNNIEICESVNFKDSKINFITDKSNKVGPNSLFVAIKGQQYDGHDFIESAVKKNAQAIVISSVRRDLAYMISSYDGSIILVENTREFLAKILSNFYGINYRQLVVLGITGTNGKTTTCKLLNSFFMSQNFRVGNFNTIDFDTRGKKGESILTTPDVFTLYKGIKEISDNDGDIVLLELSSHGIDQFRFDFSNIDIAILTNITQDHLDYHKTMKGYVETKCGLFRQLHNQSFAILNRDIQFFNDFKKSTKAKVITYGISEKADIMATEIEMDISGSKFKLLYPKGVVHIVTPLIGEHNIYNILAAIAAAYVLNIMPNKLVSVINDFENVSGRLQEIKVKYNDKFKVFVDYAHTPDALKNVLESLNKFTTNKIIVVFGCGGDRDKGKRSSMGQIVAEYSDYFIITNDNPRTEDPNKIVDDIIKGVPRKNKNYNIILDRTEAIHEAVSKGSYGDIILIAGKGHEKYQIINNNKLKFNDMLITKDILKSKFIAE